MLRPAEETRSPWRSLSSRWKKYLQTKASASSRLSPSTKRSSEELPESERTGYDHDNEKSLHQRMMKAFIEQGKRDYNQKASI